MMAEPGEHSRINEYTMDWVTEECVSIYNRNEDYFVHQNNQNGCSAQQPS